MRRHAHGFMSQRRLRNRRRNGQGRSSARVASGSSDSADQPTDPYQGSARTAELSLAAVAYCHPDAVVQDPEGWAPAVSDLSPDAASEERQNGVGSGTGDLFLA